MFTGLIVGMGDITSLQKRSGGAILSLGSDVVSDDAGIGDSIAINGVCLTVVKKNMNELSFDLSEETLRSTNLGGLKKGDRVALVGFGSFSVSKRSARTGRNPQTGKEIKIPAKKVVKFKAGAELAGKVK